MIEDIGYPINSAHEIVKLLYSDKSEEKIGKIDKTFKGCEITGFDISDEMILNAQSKIFSEKNKTAFINKDFINLGFNDSFDIIIFNYVLYHLNDPVLALNKARELLTDNGKILFSVLGIDYLKETFMPQDLDDMDKQKGLTRR